MPAGRVCFGNCRRHFPELDDSVKDCRPTGIWEVPRPLRRLRPEWRKEWIAELSVVFENCVGAHVTTSVAARDIVRETFPGLKNFHIIPHGRDIANLKSCASPPVGPPTGVLSLGHLTPSKGSALLLHIAGENAAAGHPLAIHHLGQAVNADELTGFGVVVHGKYDREMLADTLGERRFSFGLLCQLWPETFSHTLTELWGLGLPVVASNLGAVGERVQTTGAGWLLDPGEPEKWFVRLLELAQDPAQWHSAAQAVADVPETGMQAMANSYATLYRQLVSAL
jgi:glycosyltransferase involved in cell wall biosynthesis